MKLDSSIMSDIHLNQEENSLHFDHCQNNNNKELFIKDHSFDYLPQQQNSRIVISKSDGDLNGGRNQFIHTNDSSAAVLPPPQSSLFSLNSIFNEVGFFKPSNKVTGTDLLSECQPGDLNRSRRLTTSQSSHSFPGDHLQQKQRHSIHGSGTPPTNLSDSFASLYLPQFAQQISTTIMSGLNWINQIPNASTLFQQFWNNSGFLKRRFSASPRDEVDNRSNHVDRSPTSSYTYSQYKFAKILNGTIRLQTLKPSELIELSSFGLVELDQDVEPGIGHEFQRYENEKATWCDSCGEFLFPSIMDDHDDRNNKDGSQNYISSVMNNGRSSSSLGIQSATSPHHHQNHINSQRSSTPTMDKQQRMFMNSNKTTSTKKSTPASVQADHLLRTYFQCTKCKYVCHWKCLNLIRIDCQPTAQQQKQQLATTTGQQQQRRPLGATYTVTKHNNSLSLTSGLDAADVTSNDVSSIRTDETTTATVDIDSNNNHNESDQKDDEDDQLIEQNNNIDDNIVTVSICNTTTNDVSTISTDYTVTLSSNDDDDDGDDEQDKTLNDANDDDSIEFDSTTTATINNSDSNDHKSTTDTSKDYSKNIVILGDLNNKKASTTDKKTSISSSSYLITPRTILDLRAKILKYNERVRSLGSGLGITLIDEEKCLFRGFLRVHMNLTRPINVIAGKRPPSIYDIINEEENQQQQRRTLTQFYMPRDTVKNIHITSDSTSLQVIKAMLKKFKVVDNPQKFALYLRRRFPEEELTKNTKADEKDDETTRISDDNQNDMTISKFLKTAGHDHSLKRLHDHERPLILQLEFDSFAYGSVDIVLQENDNADIAWDAFEVPELKNFLKILEREEGEHLEHVKAHYREMKRVLQALIDYEENKLKLMGSNNPNNNQTNGSSSNQPHPGSSILTVTS